MPANCCHIVAMACKLPLIYLRRKTWDGAFDVEDKDTVLPKRRAQCFW